MILFNTNQTTETMTLAFITVQLLDMRSQMWQLLQRQQEVTVERDPLTFNSATSSFTYTAY